MDFTDPTLQAEISRHRLAERIARAGSPKIPATVHRQLLAQRLRRVADRVDG